MRERKNGTLRALVGAIHSAWSGDVATNVKGDRREVCIKASTRRASGLLGSRSLSTERPYAKFNGTLGDKSNLLPADNR